MGETLEDRYKRFEKDLQKAFYNTHVGSPMGSILVAGIEAVERIRRECPAEWPGDRLLGLEVQTSNLLPPGVAYMIPRPRQIMDFQFSPIELSEEAYEPLRFRSMMDYRVRIGVPRSALFTCDIGGFDEPRIVWPEPEAPAQPLSGWQWLAIVGVLSWILCAMARAV